MKADEAFTIDAASVRAWKRYSEYTDSGVEWLGEVPVGWDVQKLKFFTRVRLSSVDKKSEEDEKRVLLCNYTDVYYNDHITEDLEFMKATATPDEIASFTLRKGDVLITKDSEDWNDIAVPAHVNADLDGVLCGYHLAHIRPDKQVINSKYLFWSFNARDVNTQFRVAANGITRYGVGKYWIDNSSFLLPPLHEQRAIAAFLDRETGRIDALIAKKRRFIELLEEKRQALISHAVTKGLDPDAAMKDSGVEWIGEVPAGWEILPLSARYQVQLGKMLDKKQISGDQLAPYLRNTNVQWGRVDLSDLYEMDFSPSEREYYSLKIGDLLVCEGGDVGRTAIWEGALEECYYQKAIHRVRARSQKDNSRYLYYAMVTAAHIGVFNAGADMSTISHLTAIKLKKIRFPFPPSDDQLNIAEHLDFVCNGYENIIAKTEISIEKLHEFRTALISAAVTGKIDVRGEVPAEP